MSKPKQFLVKDYMHSKVVKVSDKASFKEALEVMMSHKTNGIVVVHDDNRVAGMLSSWDLIEHAVPDYLEEDKHLAAFESGDIFAERVKEVQNDKVVEFMSHHVHTVKADSNLMEASTLLSEFKIRQLPVVDEDGILIGYLNRTDIKNAMGEVLNLNK